MYSPTFIDTFLRDLEAANYHVPNWSSNQGVYIDWELEERQAREYAERKAARNSGAASSGTWERHQRPRR